MQKLYHESERQFLEFIEIIPLDHNPRDICSPRLVTIIQSVGSQIDGMFKLILSELNIAINIDKYENMQDLLNEHGMLSNQKITLRDQYNSFNPFENKIPSWWTAYNKTKHHLPDGMYHGILGNIIEALGALFILHTIGQILYLYTIKEKSLNMRNPKNSLLNKDYWYNFELEFNKNSDNQDGVFFNEISNATAPMTLAKLQAYNWSDMIFESKVFFSLTFYHGVWGNVNPKNSS